MVARDLQGFPVRSEMDVSLRRGALDLQAMVDAAIAAGRKPHVIDPVDIADTAAQTEAAKRAVAQARARRGIRSTGSLQARSCSVRERNRNGFRAAEEAVR